MGCATIVLVFAVLVAAVSATTCEAVTGTADPSSCNVCTHTTECVQSCRPAQEHAVAAWVMKEGRGAVTYDLVGDVDMIWRGGSEASWIPGGGAKFERENHNVGFASDPVADPLLTHLAPIGFSVEVWMSSDDETDSWDGDGRLLLCADSSDPASPSKQAFMLAAGQHTHTTRRFNVRLHPGPSGGLAESHTLADFFPASTDPHHVVVTYDRRAGETDVSTTVYLDGELVDVFVLNPEHPPGPGYFESDMQCSIGTGWNHSGERYRELDGAVYSAIVYDTVLSADQVSTLHALGVQTASPCQRPFELLPIVLYVLGGIAFLAVVSALGMAAHRRRAAGPVSLDATAGRPHKQQGVAGSRRHVAGSVSSVAAAAAAAASPDTQQGVAGSRRHVAGSVSSVAAAAASSDKQASLPGTLNASVGSLSSRKPSVQQVAAGGAKPSQGSVRRPRVGSAPPPRRVHGSVRRVPATTPSLGATYTSMPVRDLMQPDRRSSFESTATLVSINSEQAPSFG